MALIRGCGRWQPAGARPVDGQAGCASDQLVDLGSSPWLFPNDAAEEILLQPLLAHLGPDPRLFLAVMREIWQVSVADSRSNHPRAPRHPLALTCGVDVVIASVRDDVAQPRSRSSCGRRCAAAG